METADEPRIAPAAPRQAGTPLENVRHERFAQEVAQGKTLTEAYVLAGYVDDRANACHLQQNTTVKDRIRELTADAAVRAGVSVERVLTELAKIGFASMADFVTIQEDGEAVVDLTRVSPAKMAAISEITTERVGDIKRTKLKLLDKKGALVDLGRHLGMFTDKSETTLSFIPVQLTGEDVSSIRAGSSVRPPITISTPSAPFIIRIKNLSGISTRTPVRSSAARSLRRAVVILSPGFDRTPCGPPSA